MKLRKRILLFTLFLGQFAALHALNVAPGATQTRDIWGDNWMPEWNTVGDAAGYRDTTIDPSPAMWTAVGHTLTAQKFIQGTGEDRWDHSALLVFADDGSGQLVRFGMWTSDQTKGSQTVTFTIPSWARGEIKFEYWTLYGAVSNISNLQYDPGLRVWVNRKAKSHEAISYGTTGIKVEGIKPTNVSLFISGISTSPTAALVPSIQTITLGHEVTFFLTASGGDPTQTSFVGNGVDDIAPSSTVAVTPNASGIQNYILTVHGYDTLLWSKIDDEATVVLHTPKGDVDVTRNQQYIVSATNGGAGIYSAVETNAFGVSSDPIALNVTLPAPAVASSSVTVLAPSIAATVVPQASDFTVSSGPAAGHTYHRTWNDGAQWAAYLGRDGVKIAVTGQSGDSGISSFQLQAKTPAGDWADLAGIQSADGSSPNGPAVTATSTFSVKLGTTRADKPVIPTDPSLVGVWQLRARVQTTSGTWSGWSPVQPLSVQLPLATVTKTGQTLPPVLDAAWFTASDVKPYEFKVWIP